MVGKWDGMGGGGEGLERITWNTLRFKGKATKASIGRRFILGP